MWSCPVASEELITTDLGWCVCVLWFLIVSWWDWSYNSPVKPVWTQILTIFVQRPGMFVDTLTHWQKYRKQMVELFRASSDRSTIPAQLSKNGQCHLERTDGTLTHVNLVTNIFCCVLAALQGCSAPGLLPKTKHDFTFINPLFSKGRKRRLSWWGNVIFFLPPFLTSKRATKSA